MKKVYLVKLSLVETTMASWPVRSYYRGEEHSDDRFIIVFDCNWTVYKGLHCEPDIDGII